MMSCCHQIKAELFLVVYINFTIIPLTNCYYNFRIVLAEVKSGGLLNTMQIELLSHSWAEKEHYAVELVIFGKGENGYADKIFEVFSCFFTLYDYIIWNKMQKKRVRFGSSDTTNALVFKGVSRDAKGQIFLDSKRNEFAIDVAGKLPFGVIIRVLRTKQRDESQILRLLLIRQMLS